MILTHGIYKTSILVIILYYRLQHINWHMEEIHGAWYRTVSASTLSLSTWPPCTSSPHSSISYAFVEEFCQSWITWIGVVKSLITEWFQVLASISFIRSRIGGKIFSILVKWFVCLAASSNSEGTWAVLRIDALAEVQVQEKK